MYCNPNAKEQSNKHDNDYLSFQTLEDVKTVLHKPHSTANFAYDRVPWQLKIRKEVFSPAEEVRSPMAVNLIFCQVKISLEQSI